METTHEQSDSLLLFRVGPIACAVPAAVVDGIIQPPPLNHIPGSDPGVFARDHKISSVIDLRRRFGLPSGTPSAGRLLLSHQGRSRFGYWVDEVIGLEQQRNVTLRPLPDDLPRGVFDAVLLCRDELVLLSDLERLARLRGNGFISTHLERLAQTEEAPSAELAPTSVRPPHPPEAEKPATQAAAPVVTRHEASRYPEASATSGPAIQRSNASAPVVPKVRTSITDKPTLAPHPPIKAASDTALAPRTVVSAHNPPATIRPMPPVATKPTLRDSTIPVLDAPSPLHPGTTGSDAPLWLAFATILTTALLLLGWLLWPTAPGPTPQDREPPTLVPDNEPAPQVIEPRVAVIAEETSQTEEVVATLDTGPTPAEPSDAPSSAPAEAPAPPHRAPLETAESETFTAQIERQEDAIHIIIERTSRPRNKVSTVAPDFIARDTSHSDPDASVPLIEGDAEVSSVPETTAPETHPSNDLPLPTAGSCSLVVHTVVPGDTLWAIAKRYVDNAWLYPELARLSNIANPHRIYPGQKIYIEFR